MPRYILKDANTGEQSEFWGSYDEMKAHCAENPELSTVIGAPKITSGGSITDKTDKLPDGFKDKLREIKKKHPGSSGIDHLI
jgi:hypothetical protein